jgi:hypothetical protein
MAKGRTGPPPVDDPLGKSERQSDSPGLRLTGRSRADAPVRSGPWIGPNNGLPGGCQGGADDGAAAVPEPVGRTAAIWPP